MNAQETITPNISIIVPIYNTKKYLGKCLDSIMSQTMSNIEVILIDDGSSDGCEIVCDEYSHKDIRFKVVHQKNQGLSAARNNGIEIAKGNYVLFVDSDDYIKRDLCEKAYNFAIDNKADLIRFFYEEDTKKGTRFFKKQSTLPNSIIEKDSEKLKVAYTSGAMVWKFLIQRDLLLNNNLRFPLNVIYEDMDFTTKLALSATRMFVLHECLYMYRIRLGSLSWAQHPNAVEHCQQCCNSGIEFAKNMGASRDAIAFLTDQKERLTTILSHRSDCIFNEEYPQEVFYE